MATNKDLKLSLEINTKADRRSINQFGQRVGNLGKQANRASEQFSKMRSNLAKGLGAAAAGYGAAKGMSLGVAKAASLQQALTRAKMELADANLNAEELDKKLARVRKTAVLVSSNMPNSAEDLVDIQTSLLKGGLSLKDLETGAASAVASLAALENSDAKAMGDSMARVGAQFHLGGKEYKTAADWLLKISSSGSTSVEKLLYGLRLAGASASTLNVPLADTLTSLTQLAPLGEMAGSSLNGFLRGVKGNTPAAEKAMKKLSLSFFDEGSFVGMDESIKRLKKALKKITSDKEKAQLLQTLFGDEGGRAAATFVKAKESFKELEKIAHKKIGLDGRIAIWSKDLNAAMAKLGGTLDSTMASAFNPSLSILTKITDFTNSATGSLGEYLEANKEVAKYGNIALAGVAGGALVYGGSRILEGGYHGVKGLALKAGKSGLGTGLGVAKGKALEATTGVTPLYVTNGSGLLYFCK